MRITTDPRAIDIYSLDRVLEFSVDSCATRYTDTGVLDAHAKHGSRIRHITLDQASDFGFEFHFTYEPIYSPNELARNEYAVIEDFHDWESMNFSSCMLSTDPAPHDRNDICTDKVRLDDQTQARIMSLESERLFDIISVQVLLKKRLGDIDERADRIDRGIERARDEVSATSRKIDESLQLLVGTVTSEVSRAAGEMTREKEIEVCIDCLVTFTIDGI